MATISNLKTGVKGTAKEIQEFVASLKGRTPAEAMGVVAQSHLLQAIVISVLVQGGIMGLSCGFAYYRGDPPAPVAPVIVAPAPSNPRPAPVPAATNTAATSAPSEDAIKKVMNTDIIKPEDQTKKGPRDVDDILNNFR